MSPEFKKALREIKTKPKFPKQPIVPVSAKERKPFGDTYFVHGPKPKG